MRSIRDAVILGCQSGGSDDGIGESGLAATIGMPMKSGKGEGQRSGKLPFSTQKYPFPGYKYVIKNYDGLSDSIFIIRSFKLYPGAGAGDPGD